MTEAVTTDTLPADDAAAPEAKATETTIAQAEATAETKPDAQEPAKPEAKPAKEEAKPEAKPKADKPEPNPAKKDAKSILDSDEEDDKPTAAPTDWPSDWREKLAGDDAKLLSTLKRFASPKTFSESYFALKQKLSSGEYQKALPEDATPQEVAAWRKENGIPETPDKYDTTLPDGLVIGDQDKPLVDEFLTSMHEANAKPEAVKAALATYYKIVEKQSIEKAQADAAFKDESLDSLRTEWGDEFRRNVNMVSGLLSATAPEGVKDRLFGGYTSDGRKIGDDPSVMRWLVQLAREVNPAATVVPGAGANVGAAIGDELATLKAKMGDYSSDYWQGANKEKNQARYRELTEAQQRLKSRGM